MQEHSKIVSLIKRYGESKVIRDQLTSTWDEISDYARPTKHRIGTDGDFEDSPDVNRFNGLFDTSTIDANRTYAAGVMSWMTPSETTWFSYDPPDYLSENDKITSFFSRATDTTRRVLASSNFYSTIHENYLDDGAFGTSGMLIEEDSQLGLRFEALEIGEYTILENHRRLVDTVFREMGLTWRQAIQRFGEHNMAIEVQKMASENSKQLDMKGKFIHCIMPRVDADRIPGKLDARNMPWASIYIDVKHNKIVRDSGAWEMPAAVHRHLLWGRANPWGFSPGMQASSDSKQINFMQSYLDALVEKQVSPPTLLPSTHEGKVDLRAGGHTFFKDQGSMPRFWDNPGNYMIGEDRTVFRRENINRAFHVELFQALGAVPVGKQMTAAEVNMRQRDRLTLFSPTFARKNTELNTPVMKRIFAILLRAGAFGELPQELIRINAEGMPFMPDPEIVYSSRLALQIKAIHNEAFLRTIDTTGPLIEYAPDMIDNLNTDALFRGAARNEGMKEAWLRSDDDVDAIRQNRAEQMAQQQQQESAHAEADSASKMANAGLMTEAA